MNGLNNLKRNKMNTFWIIYYGIICIVGLMVAFKQLKGGNNE